MVILLQVNSALVTRTQPLAKQKHQQLPLQTQALHILQKLQQPIPSLIFLQLKLAAGSKARTAGEEAAYLKAVLNKRALHHKAPDAKFDEKADFVVTMSAAYLTLPVWQ